MTKKEYAAYLASEHWRAFRKEFLADMQSDGLADCVRCRLPRWLAELVYDQDLNLHHKHYRSLGAEESEDVELLCRRCHEIETFGRSELKTPQVAHCEWCGERHWDYRHPRCRTCQLLFRESWLMFVHDLPDPDTPGKTLGQTIIREILIAAGVWDNSVELKEKDDAIC